MTILDSCRELLEICRVKCGPSDETILPGGRTNEEAMRDAEDAIDEFDDVARALDEADTAFAVLNICDGLTPQARGCIRRAWPLVQAELAKIKGPDSGFAQAVAAVRQFPTGHISREEIARNLNVEFGREEFAADDARLTDEFCWWYTSELGQILLVDVANADTSDFHQSCFQWLDVGRDR